MHRSLFLLTACLFFLVPLSGQTDSTGFSITCSMQDTSENAVWNAPAAILDGSAEIKTQFDLVFSANVPAQAQAAMQFAADVWGSYLVSDVAVRVAIDWEDRGDNRLLASAGPTTLFRDFAGSIPDTWYPVALAEAIAGRDLNDTGNADINVNANSTANWYFGTDGNTPRRQIDLVSVMMHELGHGLGFSSLPERPYMIPGRSPWGFLKIWGGRWSLYLPPASGLSGKNSVFIQTPQRVS